jgi:hypothetical protein
MGRCPRPGGYRRRAVLADVLARCQVAGLVLSEGLAGLGERTVAQGHEGIMAKLQTSRYMPGQRSSAWRKMKPRQVLPCVIIGYTATYGEGIHSVLVASTRGTLALCGPGDQRFHRAAEPGPEQVSGPAAASPACGSLPEAGHLGGTRPLLPGAIPTVDGPGQTPQRLPQGTA